MKNKNLNYNLFFRAICAIFTVACIFGSASAQNAARDFSVGVKGGAILSQTTFSPSVEQKFHTGAMFGVTARYIEEKHFGLIAEIDFEQRGWKEAFGETSYSYSRTLSYIHVPLLAHIYFGSDKARFFFNAGPEIAFMIAEKRSANFDVNDIGQYEDFPSQYRSTEQLTMEIKNKIDYGISAGIGLEIGAGKHNSITAEGRFYYGLNNIFGANKKDVFAASNSIAIMATLGYYFHIK